MVIKEKKREKKYKKRMADLNQRRTNKKRPGAKYTQMRQNGNKKRGETESRQSKQGTDVLESIKEESHKEDFVKNE